MESNMMVKTWKSSEEQEEHMVCDFSHLGGPEVEEGIVRLVKLSHFFPFYLAQIPPQLRLWDPTTSIQGGVLPSQLNL